MGMMFNKQQAAKLSPVGGLKSSQDQGTKNKIAAIGSTKKKKPSFFGKAFEKK